MKQHIQWLARLTAILAAGLLMAGCGSESTTVNSGLTASDAASDAASSNVVLETTAGDITLSLDAERAPLTVENFLLYAQEGHYNGTVFHRVISGFMVQGGGFNTDYVQKSTHTPVANEADNGLKNTRYSIAMARTTDPQSATSQFFINVADNSFLDYLAPTTAGWGYAVFGRVIDGFDTVDSIAAAQTGAAGPFGKDVPLTQIVIESVRVQ